MIHFGVVKIFEFDREISSGAIPHNGGYPLGLGELASEVTMPFEDFDTPTRTKKRRRMPAREEARRLPTMAERGRKVGPQARSHPHAVPGDGSSAYIQPGSHLGPTCGCNVYAITD